MAVALAYLASGDPGGAVRSTSTGFTWVMTAVFREPSTNLKEVITEVGIDTLDADTLAQIRDKLAQGVKAEGGRRGFSVTKVLLPTFEVVSV
jgi:hypothetical protein